MKYHDIDNELIKNFLIHIDNNDDKIKEHLIDWHLALNKGDDDDCADKAKKLIKSFVEVSFPVIGVTLSKGKQDLFKIYAALENILRIASFLREKQRIRDHLNHTIRNILFSAYLVDNVWNEKETKQDRDPKHRQKLILACAFHDIAYPIEKLKKVAKQIIDTTLGDLINTDGKIDINISDPDKLLELIDFVGNDFDLELKRNNKFVSPQKKFLSGQIDALYLNTIVPAIADKGIFETEHSRSSTIILLRYLLDYSEYGKQIIKNYVNDILDICFSISYHDRHRNLSELNDIPEIVKILRVTDELQEWDRDSLEYSYCSDVTLCNNDNALLSFQMKDKVKMGVDDDDFKCDPFLTIRDKIKGLHGCVDEIALNFNFPDNRLDPKTLSKKITNHFKKSKPKKVFSFEFKNEIQYNTVNVSIKNNNILLRFEK